MTFIKFLNEVPPIVGIGIVFLLTLVLNYISSFFARKNIDYLAEINKIDFRHAPSEIIVSIENVFSQEYSLFLKKYRTSILWRKVLLRLLIFISSFLIITYTTHSINQEQLVLFSFVLLFLSTIVFYGFMVLTLFEIIGQISPHNRMFRDNGLFYSRFTFSMQYSKNLSQFSNKKQSRLLRFSSGFIFLFLGFITLYLMAISNNTVREIEIPEYITLFVYLFCSCLYLVFFAPLLLNFFSLISKEISEKTRDKNSGYSRLVELQKKSLKENYDTKMFLFLSFLFEYEYHKLFLSQKEVPLHTLSFDYVKQKIEKAVLDKVNQPTQLLSYMVSASIDSLIKEKIKAGNIIFSEEQTYVKYNDIDIKVFLEWANENQDVKKISYYIDFLNQRDNFVRKVEKTLAQDIPPVLINLTKDDAFMPSTFSLIINEKEYWYIKYLESNFVTSFKLSESLKNYKKLLGEKSRVNNEIYLFLECSEFILWTMSFLKEAEYEEFAKQIM